MNKQIIANKVIQINPSFSIGANPTIPTLTIGNKLLNNDKVELFIRQTHVDLNSMIIVTDHKWLSIIEFSSYGSKINHPWHGVIELRLYGKAGLKIKLISQKFNEHAYHPYNYIFNCETGLILNYIVTPGFINVFKSNGVWVNHIEANYGIRLICDRYIRNVSGSQIISHGRIILCTKKLENCNGLISGKEILGYFHSEKGFNCIGVDNRYGLISAMNGLYLYSISHINNHWGLFESKTHFVYAITDSSLYTIQGRILGKSLCIDVNGTINNRLGRIEARTGILTIRTNLFNNFDGICKGYGNCRLIIKMSINNKQGYCCSTHGKMTLNI